MEEKDFYFILVCAFFYEMNNEVLLQGSLDYVFVSVMMMKEKSVEENVLEKTKGNAWM
jgi:hypothetical protein